MSRIAPAALCSILFVVGSFLYVHIANSRANAAPGLALIKAFTIDSGYWWLALAGAVLIGMWFVRT